MSVRRSQFLAALVVILITLIPIACGTQQKAPAAAPQAEAVLNRDVETGHGLGATPPPAVTITLPSPGTAPTIPTDISGGAPNATLTQAAAFAWQEFIAATWPAQPNTNNNSYNRDVADPNGIYGATAGSASGAPLVWETFRHKVEIFPGTTSPNNYTLNTPPHGTNLSLPDYGYNDPPQYNYGTQVNLGNNSNGLPVYGPAVTGPCSAGDPNNATTAWVNADENSQIFLDTMYAGAAPQVGTQPTASQEILFLAKANKTHFMYSVNPANAGGSQLYQAFWNHSFGNGGTSDNPTYNSATANFAAYQGSVLNGQAGTITQPFIQFPSATVEAKSAWRPLTTTEASSGKFHMALVRTYHATGINNNQACWTQQAWGMIALHIIQKTPTAPYFIYATFSQADNIMNTSGQPVEDADGNVINTPNSPSNGSALDSGINNPAQNPIAANLATPGTSTSPTSTAGFETYNVTQAQCAPGSRLYLINSALAHGGGSAPREHPIHQLRGLLHAAGSDLRERAGARDSAGDHQRQSGRARGDQGVQHEQQQRQQHAVDVLQAGQRAGAADEQDAGRPLHRPQRGDVLPVERRGRDELQPAVLQRPPGQRVGRRADVGLRRSGDEHAAAVDAVPERLLAHVQPAADVQHGRLHGLPRQRAAGRRRLQLHHERRP